MISTTTISEKYGREMALLVLCCKAYLTTADTREISAFILKEQPDWKTLYELSEAHRIRPIVYEALNSLPEVDPWIKRELKQFLLEHGLRCFRCQQKINELIALMEAHSIPIQTYKGIHLSQQIHQNLSMREFTDVDFIVERKDVPTLVKVLEENGFQIHAGQLFSNSPEHYLAHLKDIVCSDKLFYYEFHYKPVGSYLAMDISFSDLFPANWKIGTHISANDYLSLITVNHGLVDLYPNLRSLVDIAMIVKDGTPDSTNHTLKDELAGYYALNVYLMQQLFGLEYNSVDAAYRPKLIASLGEKVLQRLLNCETEGRVSTSTILKTAFLLRTGVRKKLQLLKKIIVYTFTPNYNDDPDVQLKYRWMYIFYRPFRLMKHAKRHI